MSSFWIFLVLFGTSLFAEFIANDRPLLIHFDGHWYVPVLQDYSEDTFGSRIPADGGRLLRSRSCKSDQGARLDDLAGVPYSYRDHVKDLPSPAPSPPSWTQSAGHGRSGARCAGASDLRVAPIGAVRVFPDSVTSVVGIIAGAVQGYYGGLTDLLFQRFIEIWNGMPELYLLIILAQHHHAKLLGAADIPAAVPLDEPDRAGARRIPARPQSRICPRGEGTRCLRHHRDVAAYPAQRDGCDADLSAIHPVGLGDLAVDAGFSRASACRRDRPRSANSWRRPGATCRHRGSGSPRSSCWAAC